MAGESKPREILRGWEEIERFARVSRWTLRRWIKEYGCPIIKGWGKRPPVASRKALEEFIARLHEICSKKKDRDRTMGL